MYTVAIYRQNTRLMLVRVIERPARRRHFRAYCRFSALHYDRERPHAKGLQFAQEIPDHGDAMIEAGRVIQHGDGLERGAQAGMRRLDLGQKRLPMA